MLPQAPDFQFESKTPQKRSWRALQQKEGETGHPREKRKRTGGYPQILQILQNLRQNPFFFFFFKQNRVFLKPSDRVGKDWGWMGLGWMGKEGMC